MRDCADVALGQHLDQIEADDQFAARCAAAREHVQIEREIVMREQLVKPGSRIHEILQDETAEDPWLDEVDALIRRAANPLPLTEQQRLAIADGLVRAVNAMIGRVAERGLDKAVEEYVRAGKDLRFTEEWAA